MMYPVLVVSDTPGFTELIQITLEDDGRYEPFCVGRAELAVRAARQNAFVVAIVDCDITDMPLQELVQALRTENVQTRLVIIPPRNDCTNLLVQELGADACLTKPFYIPDLLRILDKITQPAVEVPSSLEVPVTEPVDVPGELKPDVVPPWLQDVNRVAQHLTRLSLESAAHAALIVRGGELWAYAGDLPQEAAQELAHQLGRYWSGARQGQSDLARFVHLKSTASDYMLYATSLATNMALALAFNAATPFTKMRAQAADLARALATAAPPLPLGTPPAPSPCPGQVLQPEADLPPLPPDDADIPLLDLGDVPPPMPHRARKQVKGNAPPATWGERMPAGDSEVDQPSFSPAFESLSAAFDFNQQLNQAPPDVIETPTAASEWIPAPVAETTFPVKPPTQTGTRPVVSTRHPDTRPLRLDPPSPTVCSLSFACVLVPRLPQHHLVGDIADQLPALIRQVCLAFGWRLEHMALRPDYLQWLVKVPPSTSASYLMRILRYQLSDRLFEKFPGLAKDNPSGDFWAPGYLIMSSQQLPPPNIVSEFVANTRRYQGVNQTLENER